MSQTLWMRTNTTTFSTLDIVSLRLFVSSLVSFFQDIL